MEMATARPPSIPASSRSSSTGNRKANSIAATPRVEAKKRRNMRPRAAISTGLHPNCRYAHHLHLAIGKTGQDEPQRPPDGRELIDEADHHDLARRSGRVGPGIGDVARAVVRQRRHRSMAAAERVVALHVDHHLRAIEQRADDVANGPAGLWLAAA